MFLGHPVCHRKSPEDYTHFQGATTHSQEETNFMYASFQGYGQTGSYAKRAGHDINYVALSGLLSKFGRKDQKPTPPVNVLADFAGGGMTCALGILLALYERSKSGKGQVVDASMVRLSLVRKIGIQ